MPDEHGNFKGIAISKPLPWHMGRCDVCQIEMPYAELDEVVAIVPRGRDLVVGYVCESCAEFDDDFVMT